MRKKLLLAVASVFFFALAFYAPREASAVPAFARQTGMACNSCHFQHFPTLNAFGRSFKAGGYTMVGGQSLIEGDFLSLPSTLNASLVTKVGFQKRNGDSNATTSGSAGELNKGQFLFPDEAALLIGGRAGEHIGFLIEASLKDGDSRFTSYKTPIVFDLAGTTVGAVPFSTDAAGAPYGFELLNTGALRMQRPLEHRTETSSQQYIGTSTSATGLAFIASNSLWFANYTMYAPVHGDNASGPYLHYARAAVTPTVAGWDLGLGVQWWGGTTKRFTSTSTVDTTVGGENVTLNLTDATSDITRESAKAVAFDAQAQGNIGDMPLGVYLTYARTPKSSDATVANIFNLNGSAANTEKAKSAWTLTGELGVVPNRLSVAAAFRAGRDGDPNADGKETDNATTLGLIYQAAQNFQVSLNNSWYSGDSGPSTGSGNMLTTIMLFAAF